MRKEGEASVRQRKNCLITGGAGFIGSNFIRYLFEQPDFTGNIVNVDALTYAGNPASLQDIAARYSNGRYVFEQLDITELEPMKEVLNRYQIDTIVHFAAESHVDRSIQGPAEFVKTNILGTFSLLEAARSCWGNRQDVLFHHVSTDEVFGSLGPEGYFTEETAYDPRSPYSASKAASDHLVRAAHHTYGLPVTLSNCSNNFGPYQFPEKLIPLMLLNMLEEKPLPIYGDGLNIRDWLYVDDHCSAIDAILKAGKIGETYAVGGDNEWTNIDLVNLLCETTARLTNRDKDYYKQFITYIQDRPGHDRRYAIDSSKIKGELGWKPDKTFRENIEHTIGWYMSHGEWIEQVRSGEYRNWLALNYSQRDNLLQELQ